MGKSAIVLDFKVSPMVFFRRKSDALEAKKSATENGIRTRLTKTKGGYVLKKI